MAQPTKADLTASNKQLQKEIDEQNKTLLKMQKAIENMQKEGAAAEMVERDSPSLPSLVEEKYKTESFNIRPDEYVEIISLCPNDLYLSVSPSDDTPEKFEYVGESKHVLYGDLVKIINRHGKFARDGVFYIVDERIVKRHNLIKFYDDILTKDEIEKLMTSDSDVAIKMFKMANRNQQSYLSDMFIKKIVSGDNVDMNMVYKMGQILGTDIAKNAEDVKEFKALLIKK